MAKTISRRALFASGAALAAGALLTPMLGGCAAGESDQADSAGAGEPDSSSEVRTYPTHVHTTDVLVIGSGVGGCTAAIKAMQLGASVTVLDKAQYGHSGNSGMNWGHMYGLEPAEDSDIDAAIAEGIRMSYGLGDQNIIALLTHAAQDQKMSLLIENLGGVTERLEDGTPGCCFYGQPTPGVTAGFFPRFLSQKVKRMGAEIYERTMLLDVLTDAEGQAAGGVALDLTSGELHVFRAKSVIMAMGGFSWMYGWSGLRPNSMGSIEYTGDGTAILMKHGVPVSNLEFYSSDYNTYYPACVRDTMAIGLEIPDYHRARDIDGNAFMFDYMLEHPTENCIGMVTALIAGELAHGRGSEHGGVWLDIKDFEGQELELFYRRFRENYKRNFDYELPDLIEMIPDYWESFYMTKVDETMQTQMPGLYFVKYGTNLGGTLYHLLAMGQISGENAAKRAASEDFAAIDWEAVNATLDHTYELLEREPEDGIPAWQVMRNIQLAVGSSLEILRNGDDLQAALDELKRIREEDLPKMCVPEKTRVLNTEWRRAIETENLVVVAIGTAMAALERRESRFQHNRTDYPYINNDEFMKRFAVWMEGDEIKMAEETPDMSIIDPAELAPLINATNIHSIHGE